jgi:hypothetical protein
VDLRYLGIVPFVALVLWVTVRHLPRLWRNETPYWDHAPSGWPWGERAWVGFVRGLPTTMAAGCLLVLAMVLGIFIPEHPRDALGFVRPWWYTFPLAALPFTMTALWLSIFFFRRPRMLIPPHLRDGPA